MYTKVKLLQGYKEPLIYSIPSSCKSDIKKGSIVQVPLRNRTSMAVVLDVFEKLEPAPTFTIRSLSSVEPFPSDKHYHSFIEQLSSCYQIDPIHFIKRIRIFFTHKGKSTPIHDQVKIEPNNNVTLTEEQKSIVNALSPAIKQQQYHPALLHGATGSGKTECYKHLIECAIAQNKTALLLLPEVSLAVNFANILQRQMPHLPIFSFHSATSIIKKRQLWKALIDNTPLLIIGVHLPVLLPISNLGLIIIDEEHDVGFQEKKHPKVNSKDAALLRAQIYSIPICLGSATPAISSLYNVQQKNWKLFHLKKRFVGMFPKIELVDLGNKKQRKNFWISTHLLQALNGCIEKKEQAIVFINRRGYSFFVQCKKCSFIFECKHCSVSLTLHDNLRLQCHYCGTSHEQPKQCPTCQAPDSQFLKKGIGTQQVVRILQRMIPNASIARADLDSTINKKQWQQTMYDMHEKKIDILVGTQTITKGYHFPNVTVVGIIWADLNLNFPLYNAAETALQQLIQVAGRAGRSDKPSRVIVQTMIDHPVLHYVNETSYLNFYERELESRTLIGYPPCMRLVEVEIRHENEDQVERDAQQVSQRLRTTIKTKQNIVLLGPSQPPLHKVKNVHVRKLYLKSPNLFFIIKAFESIEKTDIASMIFFTQNPLTL